ncbi:hypothetical protein [Burkholderia ubonensis]|uniref:hypothetical protein n=1 Tax=Burkholderia ubonensis TaxID=101571 RepID=UPI0012F7780F|nr:hypothetical protein [Burkholderia ubonensis]
MMALVLNSHALPATSACAAVSASGKTRINVRRAFACAACREIGTAASGCRCAVDRAFMIPRNVDMRGGGGPLFLSLIGAVLLVALASMAFDNAMNSNPKFQAALRARCSGICESHPTSQCRD